MPHFGGQPRLIQLEGVTKSYPRTGATSPVLRVAALEIAAGERVALMGTSGSGKTTLLNIISGLVLPDGGAVRLDGVEVNALSEPQRDRLRARKVGYLFQNLHLLEGFTALENVELGVFFTGNRVDRQHARELLAAVGLEHRERHQPSELSMGQQSRVALARSLINRPRVLLADEPTGSLDQETGDAVLELLLETAAREQITVVCATHDPRIAAALDRTVRVEELG